MFTRRIFADKVGLAAVASIVAMVGFNIFALTQQLGMTPEALLVVAPLVELA